jgi:hypothetical protein
VLILAICILLSPLMFKLFSCIDACAVENMPRA